MRRYLTVFVILGSLIFLTAGSTLALPLPWIDYSGAVKIENGIVDQTEVRINSVVYQNGETSTFWDLMSGSADPIIGQRVQLVTKFLRVSKMGSPSSQIIHSLSRNISPPIWWI